MTRSVTLMMNVLHGVIIGKSFADPLLADLAGLLVDEADQMIERDLVRQVLLLALLN